ncbi:hypothetical protein ElyMa_005624900 [Elysia marginata]|uniref:Uncharacterized protein n=1 Tax=Elysia marginata TaxID=1093978 RepID=A0AAV4F801_9GAST|nr:hypothetical protein ElyMa_005624900 [Elysia marginata]
MDEVFETFDDVVAELWSSPLMNHKSPFDDYKDLYVGYERPTKIPVPISPASPFFRQGCMPAEKAPRFQCLHQSLLRLGNQTMVIVWVTYHGDATNYRALPGHVRCVYKHRGRLPLGRRMRSVPTYLNISLFSPYMAAELDLLGL